jgi:phosphoribosylanthranilate isomerase
MLTQVYEVTDTKTARAISEIGVDHIGTKVGDGSRPRELTVVQALAVKASVGPKSKFSALFMSADLGLIAEWLVELSPHIAHFGAAADQIRPEHIARLKAQFPAISMMRSIPMFGETSLAIAEGYDGIADFLMLDTVRNSDQKFGALGVAHDWTISRRIVERLRCPVLLAGGIGPDNVAEAIATVRPAGVDSKTKTDIDGGHEKDLEKVRQYHLAAKAASV